MTNKILQSIRTIAQSLIDKADYDKTRTGRIAGVNIITNTYTVDVDGHLYNNVKTVNDFSYATGDIVKVRIPCNQPTQIYITGSCTSDTSIGKKTAQALALGEENRELIEELETQIDSKIETWAQMTNPASAWTTTALQEAHDGDLWYYTGVTNLTVGTTTILPSKTYQYDSSTNKWVLFQSANESLFDFADGKSTVFYGSPTVIPTGVENDDYLVDPDTGNTYKFDGSTRTWTLVTDYKTPIDGLTSNIATIVDELGNVYQLYITTTYTTANVIYTAVLTQNGIDITNETTSESGTAVPKYSNDMVWYTKTINNIEYLGTGASISIPKTSLYYGQAVTVWWVRRAYAYLLNNGSNNLVISNGNKLIVRTNDNIFREE